MSVPRDCCNIWTLKNHLDPTHPVASLSSSRVGCRFRLPGICLRLLNKVVDLVLYGHGWIDCLSLSCSLGGFSSERLLQPFHTWESATSHPLTHPALSLSSSRCCGVSNKWVLLTACRTVGGSSSLLDTLSATWVTVHVGVTLVSSDDLWGGLLLDQYFCKSFRRSRRIRFLKL